MKLPIQRVVNVCNDNLDDGYKSQDWSKLHFIRGIREIYTGQWNYDIQSITLSHDISTTDSLD